MISIKRIFIIISLLFLVFSLALGMNFFVSSVSTVSKNYVKNQIILDAGHEAFANTIKTPKNHRQAKCWNYPENPLKQWVFAILELFNQQKHN